MLSITLRGYVPGTDDGYAIVGGWSKCAQKYPLQVPNPCANNCSVGFWTYWDQGECNATCGGGYACKTRQCLSICDGATYVDTCYGNWKECERCNTHECSLPPTLPSEAPISQRNPPPSIQNIPPTLHPTSNCTNQFVGAEGECHVFCDIEDSEWSIDFDGWSYDNVSDVTVFTYTVATSLQHATGDCFVNERPWRMEDLVIGMNCECQPISEDYLAWLTVDLQPFGEVYNNYWKWCVC